MPTLHQFPYFEVDFDKHGQRTSPAIPTLPPGTTDLIVLSHGWNNDKPEARRLYAGLIKNVGDHLAAAPAAGRQLAVVGVFWPSQRFFAKTAAELGADGGATAGVGRSVADKASIARVRKQLTQLGVLLSASKLPDEGRAGLAPAIKTQIDALKRLVSKLDTDRTARERFVARLKLLIEPAGQAESEDGSAQFFANDDGEDLFQKLRLQPGGLDKPASAGGGPATAIVPGAGRTDDRDETATAGLLDKVKGFAASALNLVNYVTYYQMKARAGLVGKDGVAPLIDALAGSVERIHLVGHSFGGRVVTAAAANSTTSKLHSLGLLQAAFSHNGLSRTKKGFFRRVIDERRIAGPIYITHTANDKAVGVAYPIASRLSGDKTSALGDEKDEFGGMGRNGAQAMETGEVDAAETALRAASQAYAFGSRVFNLKADPFIADHGDVENVHVANAVVAALRF